MSTLIQKPGTDKWYVKMMYKGKRYERATGESDKRKAKGRHSRSNTHKRFCRRLEQILR